MMTPHEAEQLKVLQQLGRSYRGMLGAFELSVGQGLTRWRILNQLHKETQCSQKALIQQLKMDPGSLTRLLKAMEKEGLIQRSNDPQDNRLSNVTLTPQGHAEVSQALPKRSAFLSVILEEFNDEELLAFQGMLNKLERGCEKAGIRD
jgi:MarR family transcriptional regulator, organic hydroperoxide resistance regulator